MKVMENLERKNKYGKWRLVYYCLNVTFRVKDYAFQINRLLHILLSKLNLTINMQLLHFITTVTSHVHSARHHQRAGYSALASI